MPDRSSPDSHAVRSGASEANRVNLPRRGRMLRCPPPPRPRRPVIELFAEVSVAAPVRRCFDLTRSVEAHRDSSTLIGGRPVAGRVAGLSELGDETTWSARFFGVRFRVRTKITAMNAPAAYREERAAGLPRTFEHEYRFHHEGDRTRIEDTFRIGLPLGAAADRVVGPLLRPRLRAAQRRRLDWLRRACEGDGWTAYLPA